MTRLYVINGNLQIIDAERLTTNAINAYEIHVDFAEDWSGFTQTAILYQTTKGKRYEIDFVGNVFIVPKTILQVNLPVYVGISGKSGTTRKTTNFIKLEIAEGATSEKEEVTFVQTVDTKINYIRLNENNVFQYSTDGNNWLELKGVAADNEVLINGSVVQNEDGKPNILTDTDSIAYESVDESTQKKLTLANSIKKAIESNTNEIASIKSKSFAKVFSIDDFSQLGTEQKYVMAIKKNEHGLKKPFVDKILLNQTADQNETTSFQTSVVMQEKTLPTDTIKIYVTIDLSKLTEYSGIIYLRGE